jgi:hypothetical protein
LVAAVFSLRLHRRDACATRSFDVGRALPAESGVHCGRGQPSKLEKIYDLWEAQNKGRDHETGPFGEFFVWWDDISYQNISALEECLRTAKNENDIQKFLKENPLFLIQHLGGGHGRWLIPKQRLGAEFETDFIIGESSSKGFEWQAVELESPKVSMFNKKGDPTKELTHAIRQIQDWRAWLNRNQNYAARPKVEGGLGLTDIASTLPGLVLLGRRSSLNPSTNERRRQMVNDLNIDIHSYDFLVDRAKGRVESLLRSGRLREPDE